MIISAVLHEAGHISACILCHKIPKTEVSVFGLKLSEYPDEKYKKLFVLSAGPMINFLLILLSYYKLKDNFNLHLYVFLCVNFILFIFNILPIHFLDGGQIFMLFCNNTKTHKAMETVSFLFILTAIIIFSDNTIISVFAAAMFFMYYMINKKDLQ